MGLLLAALALGCTSDDEEEFIQLNGTGEYLVIDVGAEQVEAERSIDLLDAATDTLLGTATVDPGAGPVGTEHNIVVFIEDDYRNLVDRVTVRSFSGARGIDEYALDIQDAGEEVYETTLISVGDEGETRADLLTIRAWDEIEDEEEDDNDADD